MGLTGAGGGTLAVPALVVLMGWTIQQAVPVALITIACTSAIATVWGLYQGRVRYRAAGLMTLIGVPTTFAGKWLAQFIPETYLLWVFTLVISLMGIQTFKRARQLSRDGSLTYHASLAHINKITGRFHWNLATWVVLIVIGGLTGGVAGLLGVGGSFLMVPLLHRYTDIPSRDVVATALTVVFLVSLMAFITSPLHELLIPSEVAIMFGLACVLGMIAGQSISRYLAKKYEFYLFSCLMLVIALALIYKIMT